MGYRTFKTAPHPKRRNMQDTSTPGKIFLANGVTTHMAIPCFYQEVHEPQRVAPHNRPMHDHLGWPDPKRRDHSCQLYEPMEAGWREPPSSAMGRHPVTHRYVDGARLIPIHLLSEYKNPTIKVDIEGHPTQVHGSASIDESQDWIIRLRFAADWHSDNDGELNEPKTYKFSVYLYNYDDSHSTVDPKLVMRGELVLLPGIYY